MLYVSISISRPRSVGPSYTIFIAVFTRIVRNNTFDPTLRKEVFGKGEVTLVAMDAPNGDVYVSLSGYYMTVDVKVALETSARHRCGRVQTKRFQHDGLGVLQLFNIQDRPILIMAATIGPTAGIVHDGIDFSQANFPFFLVLR